MWNLKIILALAIIGIINGKDVLKVTICKDKSEKISCKDKPIAILKATFGRSKREACSYTYDWFTYCTIDITQKIKDKCKNEEPCNLEAKALDLGAQDLCPSVNGKYLEVLYTCDGGTLPTTKAPVVFPNASIQTETFCELFLDDVRCSESHVLNIISIFWGRKFRDICLTNYKDPNSLSCVSEKFLPDILEHCNGRNTCTVYPHVDWLGNPCPDTSKYFQIRYQCIKKPTPKTTTTTPPTKTPVKTNTTTTKTTTTATPTKSPVKTNTKIVCEKQNSFIFCTPKKTNIIKARYGRRNNTICSTEEDNFAAAVSCTTDSTNMINFTCHYKTFCILSADSGQLGDPCPGISKYLEIEYTCIDIDIPDPTTILIPSVPTPPAFTGTTPFKQCGAPKVSTAKVINGDIATPGSWPWQVAFYKTKSDDFFCGGSIISPLWILTAAHCFKNATASLYYAVVGDNDRTKIEGTEQKFMLDKIIKHADYSITILHDNDIALVKLQRPIIFDNFISSVCLPNQNDVIPTGTDVFVSGWGKDTYPGYFSLLLKQAKLTTVSKIQCQQKLVNAPGSPGKDITDNMLCAESENEKTSCQGDSGGPFVYKNKDNQWVQMGIISWGSPRCSSKDMYLVVTNVPKYINWINNNMI